MSVSGLDMLVIKRLGNTDYETVWKQMKEQTNLRREGEGKNQWDECWLTQHRDVYTLGSQVNLDDIKANPQKIPIVPSDRGGGITWHGLGQPVFYLLLDIRRKGWGPKKLVSLTEQAVISFLSSLNIEGHRREGMPGVYVRNEKIASLGFRIRWGCCYHGISFNHSPDLSFFEGIHTCGYEDLRVTSLQKLQINISQQASETRLLEELGRIMCYNLVDG